MNTIVQSYEKIKLILEKINSTRQINIVAVSKTFSLEHIKPLIDHGHTHFGENKVQEAVAKWSSIKEKKNINLHMVGKLQSNKAKVAANIFDYIHSLDNQKLADILSNCEMNNGKKLKYFIQINIGNELQKSGMPLDQVEQFYNYCKQEKKLNILGLMVIPPNDLNTKKYFKTVSELNASLGFQELSMGMSADFEEAVHFNSTYVRIGSSIFGSRN